MQHHLLSEFGELELVSDFLRLPFWLPPSSECLPLTSLAFYAQTVQFNQFNRIRCRAQIHRRNPRILWWMSVWQSKQGHNASFELKCHTQHTHTHVCPEAMWRCFRAPLTEVSFLLSSTNECVSSARDPAIIINDWNGLSRRLHKRIRRPCTQLLLCGSNWSIWCTTFSKFGRICSNDNLVLNYRSLIFLPSFSNWFLPCLSQWPIRKAVIISSFFKLITEMLFIKQSLQRKQIKNTGNSHNYYPLCISKIHFPYCFLCGSHSEDEKISIQCCPSMKDLVIILEIECIRLHWLPQMKRPWSDRRTRIAI